MLEKHSLTYPTEVGSIKIEIENDLDLYKDSKKYGSDSYYLTKVLEIKNQLISLNEEKKWNDIIWENIKFKTHVGIRIYLYLKEENKYLCSIISPDEWKNKFNFIGDFVLNTDSIWIKNNTSLSKS